jgi:hypothetical protein
MALRVLLGCTLRAMPVACPADWEAALVARPGSAGLVD